MVFLRRIELSSVKDCGVIFAHGNSVILSGKNPWLFRKDGSFVAKYKQIRNAYDMVFLPGNIVVMDGLADQSYHFISLDTGELLWSCIKKGKRDFFPRKFAVSDDGEIVYYVYSIKRILYVDRLILSERNCSTYSIPLPLGTDSLGATAHCYCDANGCLCMFQTFLLPQKDENEKSYFFQGILQWHPDDPISTWKHHWTVPSGIGSTFRSCSCNDEYVLLDNLKVCTLKNGKIFDLLENQQNMPPVFGGCRVQAYDYKKKLLTVQFSYSGSNMIVDCSQKKIVSHYVPSSRSHIGGCLINDEFWMGSDDGIVKRPFPHMDALPTKL